MPQEGVTLREGVTSWEEVAPQEGVAPQERVTKRQSSSEGGTKCTKLHYKRLGLTEAVMFSALLDSTKAQCHPQQDE